MTGHGLVLDASMALSWCFEDEFTQASGRVLERVHADGAVVPALWDLEIANVFAVAERRGRATPVQIHRFLALLGQLPIELADHEPAVTDVVATCRETGLTAYDACYLLTAMRGGLPLATLDERLADAAREVGVTLVG